MNIGNILRNLLSDDNYKRQKAEEELLQNKY